MPGRTPHAHRVPREPIEIVRPWEAVAFLLPLLGVMVGLAFFLGAADDTRSRLRPPAARRRSRAALPASRTDASRYG